MYLCIYVSMYLCIYVSMYLSIYASTYLRIYVSTYLCIYVSMYVCMYLILCIYTLYTSLYIIIQYINNHKYRDHFWFRQWNSSGFPDTLSTLSCSCKDWSTTLEQKEKRLTKELTKELAKEAKVTQTYSGHVSFLSSDRWRLWNSWRLSAHLSGCFDFSIIRFT